MVTKDIQKKIQCGRCGTLYFLDSFPEYDAEYVRKILSALVAEGTLVRIANGIFLKPTRTKYGILYPEVRIIIEAIAKRDHTMIIAEGNAAMYQLGLSTQVPTKYVYLTNGSARILHLGSQEVQLKRGVPKNFAFLDPFMATFHQALKAHGDSFNENELAHIKKIFHDYANPKYVPHDMTLMPVWMRKLVHE